MNNIPKREGNSFTCKICKNTYLYSKEWTEEDAIEEYQRDFPATQNHTVHAVCDDCHKEISIWIKSLTSHQKKMMMEEYEREQRNIN